MDGSKNDPRTLHATYISLIDKENRKSKTAKLNAFVKQNLNMFSAKLHSNEALVSHGVLQL